MALKFPGFGLFVTKGLKVAIHKILLETY